jgi:N-acyl-phosphatidylethanolamine-hydrolysing phospholipase D
VIRNKVLTGLILVKKAFLLWPTILFLQGCSPTMDKYNSPNFNQDTGRFQHPDGDKHNKSAGDLFDFFSAYFKREGDEWESEGFSYISRSKAEMADFKENVMWIGHASILINHKNVTVLTDPQFSNRASPFSFMGPKRVTPSPLEIDDLPDIDIVVISHNHYDHLDEASIRKLSETQHKIQFLVPLGLKSLLQDWGVKNVTELDWWQPVKINGLTIQPTPVQHWSKRTFFDRNKTLWAGWMMQWHDFAFYFAGDTGYSSDFIETARRLGKPDLAAIPIGAYEPRDFMKSAHINPEEAVKVFNDLGAKYAIGIHWGTFKLTLEPMNEPPVRLKRALESAGIDGAIFRALKHGEMWPDSLPN